MGLTAEAGQTLAMNFDWDANGTISESEFEDFVRYVLSCELKKHFASGGGRKAAHHGRGLLKTALGDGPVR